MTILDRNVKLWGEDSQEKLSQSTVAVFGIGGVGCACVEALVRSGVGSLFLADFDVFEESNLNRQLYATQESVGRKKTEVARERAFSINPHVKITTYDFRFNQNSEIDFTAFDFVCDCIDTVSAKVELVKRCKEKNVPILCCMGTGNKLDATAFRVADVSKTSVCPLARAFRKLLKQENVENVRVVYSTEQPQATENGRTPASCAFVPNSAGNVMAGEAVKYLITRTQ